MGMPARQGQHGARNISGRKLASALADVGAAQRTGRFRPRLAPDSLGFGRVPKLAVHALISMMADAEKQAVTLLQWLGETPRPRVIDSEIGDLIRD